jgi:hypothetical protein
MELGFTTIGNATLICYDNGPILATDPWLMGPAYFGSWTLSYMVPDEQMEAVKRCTHIFISHGHPDHLSLESLALLKDKSLLLPDHVGSRIKKDLEDLGYRVAVLMDGNWTQLSRRIHVMSIADCNQDGAIIVDLGGTLILNLNDGAAYGWKGFLQRLTKKYSKSFLLKLFGFGDADMNNFVDENGKQLQPPSAKRWLLGRSIQSHAEDLGATDVIPFSSFHKYQRSDSVWLNQHVTRLEDYPVGFDSRRCTLHPAFISYDCLKDEINEIRPSEAPALIVDSKSFGDDWNEPLESNDAINLRHYFHSIEHLKKVVDFIEFRVGGHETVIDIGKRGAFKKGLRFEAPRHSLMQAIRYECFDDLLIGNFMKTCLIGPWPNTGLYPEFSPYVAKYADNGQAKSVDELRHYFLQYRRRVGTVHYLHAMVSHKTANLIDRFAASNSSLYYAARSMKRWAEGRPIHQ